MDNAKTHGRRAPHWLRRCKHELDWWAKQRQLRDSGIDVRGLPRVQEFVRTRFRIDSPHYVHPLQRPTGFIRSLTSKPWHERSDYPWISTLEDHHDVIANELQALRDSGRFLAQHQGITSTGQWNVFYLYNYGDRIDENCALCPETTRLVESIPRAIEAGRVYFSAMTEGTTVAPHCGPSNTRIRCHFGLAVPENCGIRVAGEARTWQSGRCIVFDDSFTHEVWNHGPGTRIVLILDVWHPDLTTAEIDAISKLTMLRPGIRALTQLIRDGKDARTDDWWT